MGHDLFVKLSAAESMKLLFAQDDLEFRKSLISTADDFTFQPLELAELDYPELHRSYSGFTPVIYLDSKLKGVDAIHNVYKGMKFLAREFYLHHDKANLSAWFDDGFPVVLERVNKLQLFKFSQNSYESSSLLHNAKNVPVGAAFLGEVLPAN